MIRGRYAIRILFDSGEGLDDFGFWILGRDDIWFGEILDEEFDSGDGLDDFGFWGRDSMTGGMSDVKADSRKSKRQTSPATVYQSEIRDLRLLKPTKTAINSFTLHDGNSTTF